MKLLTVFFTNCLAYWYRYEPKFYNWLPVFLEKEQTTGTNQNFIIRCRYFSCCYLFVSLWYFSHMSLPYLLSDGLIFFCFSLCVGPWGCCVLNLKSTRGVTHFLTWWGIVISLTCISLPLCLGEWLEVWTRGFIKDNVINGRLMNTISYFKIPVE